MLGEAHAEALGPRSSPGAAAAASDLGPNPRRTFRMSIRASLCPVAVLLSTAFSTCVHTEQHRNNVRANDSQSPSQAPVSAHESRREEMAVLLPTTNSAPVYSRTIEPPRTLPAASFLPPLLQPQRQIHGNWTNAITARLLQILRPANGESLPRRPVHVPDHVLVVEEIREF